MALDPADPHNPAETVARSTAQTSRSTHALVTPKGPIELAHKENPNSFFRLMTVATVRAGLSGSMGPIFDPEFVRAAVDASKGLGALAGATPSTPAAARGVRSLNTLPPIKGSCIRILAASFIQVADDMLLSAELGHTLLLFISS